MKLVRFALSGTAATWEDDLFARIPAVSFGIFEADISPIRGTQAEILSDCSHLNETGVTDGTTAFRSDGPVVPVGESRLLAPIRPASLRDFMTFEDHARGGAARRGEELNQAWFEFPISYKGNARQILGPTDPLPYPAWTEWLDFELELGCVIGRPLHRASVEEAQSAIAGYTIMNDWSARDVQREEMAMRLGPARSKDFATSLGPCLVTPDAFDPRDGATMRALVDGVVWFEGSCASMHWPFADIISWVSQTEWVMPGDVFGSGTAFGGCGLDQDRRIPRTCVVTFEVEGIGTLNTAVT